MGRWCCAHTWRRRDVLNDRYRCSIHCKRMRHILKHGRRDNVKTAGAGAMYSTTSAGVTSRGGRTVSTRQCTHRPQPWVQDQPGPRAGSLLECDAPSRPSLCGTLGFLGIPPTCKTHLVPPGVCGSTPLLTVRDSRSSRAYRKPTCAS